MPCVSVIGTLINVTLCTAGTSIAIPLDRKVSTDWSRGVGANMGITARKIRAFTTNEMQAGRYTFGRRVMREITSLSGRAGSFLKKGLADGYLAWIMSKWA